MISAMSRLPLYCCSRRLNSLSSVASHGIAVGRVDTFCAGSMFGGEDVAMPKGYPDEFTRDVASVTRRGDLTILDVDTDFRGAEETVRR